MFEEHLDRLGIEDGESVDAPMLTIPRDQLDRLLRDYGTSGRGVLVMQVPVLLEIRIPADGLTVEMYRGMADLASDVGVDEEESEQVRQLKQRAKARLRWRSGCDWEVASADLPQGDRCRRPGVPMPGDLSPAGLGRLDAYLDLIIDQFVLRAKRAAMRSPDTSRLVEAYHVDAAAALILRTPPLFDQDGDERR